MATATIVSSAHTYAKYGKVKYRVPMAGLQKDAVLLVNEGGRDKAYQVVSMGDGALPDLTLKLLTNVEEAAKQAAVNTVIRMFRV